ncbi:CPBP family intramembrane metalloprotease [Candidatus Peregrinibacteria bacterium]|nr:MAG: CPBP family intramembrane metalloprotease [Candidatus Peregrinibacteria bacterium]
MINNYEYRPFTYFSIVLLITWITGFLAAYFSYDEVLSSYKIPLILTGMLIPFITAVSMIYGSKNKELIQDFKNRIFNLKLIKAKYWLVIFLIMPITVLLATLISILFQQPIQQFNFAPELIQVTGGEIIIILIILLLAPTFEELGWRGYGVDSLKKGRVILKATIIYAILWNLWHWPLFAISGYYQNELIHMNSIYAINFLVSIFPAAFLMNWIYYKNSRSISAIIIFHMMLNLFSVLFQTEQFTKCIITIILLIISGIVIWKDKDFFLKEKN